MRKLQAEDVSFKQQNDDLVSRLLIANRLLAVAASNMSQQKE
jgi:hypothetical protein